jgi:hypothetical protein
MKLLVILMFIPVFATAQIRNDYKMHFLTGAAVAPTVLHLPSIQGQTKAERLLLCVAASSLVGVAGEAFDSVTGGSVEGNDILYTALGGLVSGALNIFVVQRIGRKRMARNRYQYISVK